MLITKFYHIELPESKSCSKNLRLNLKSILSVYNLKESTDVTLKTRKLIKIRSLGWTRKATRLVSCFECRRSPVRQCNCNWLTDTRTKWWARFEIIFLFHWLVSQKRFKNKKKIIIRRNIDIVWWRLSLIHRWIVV